MGKKVVAIRGSNVSIIVVDKIDIGFFIRAITVTKR